MNDDIYIRKDVYEAQQDHILDQIAHVDSRVDDLRDNMNRLLSSAGIFFSAIAVILPIIMYYLTKN